jgi:uncharacterized phage protein (TIGR01671 family)
MYKVYSKSQRKQLEPRDCGVTGDGQSLEYIWYDDIGWIEMHQREKEDIVFCLKTGFKDKNGTDIYEGDIFKGFKCPFLGAFMRYKGVEYHNGAFVVGILGYENTRYLYEFFEITEYFELNVPEIIGNIFENPELLETR